MSDLSRVLGNAGSLLARFGCQPKR